MITRNAVIGLLTNLVKMQTCYNKSSLSQLPIFEMKQNIVFCPLICKATLTTKKEASQKLQELLNVPLYKANKIVSDTKFTKLATESLENNYYVCLQYGLTKQDIESNPNILANPSLDIKLETLQMLPYNIDVTIPLLSFSVTKISSFVQNELSVKRIEEFSKLFQVTAAEVCKWFSQKPFLQTIDINNVKECVRILLENGVTLRAIINDLWVLRYSPRIIEERIKLAKENNIDDIKTWMIRAQKEIFDNYVRRRSDTKEILGDKHDLVEYLSEKLACSTDVAKFLILKQPALQKKSLRKMNEMIDFLLATGFTSFHICRTPKILLHSVETIKKRLKELDDNNMKLDSLHILTKSQRQYMSVFDSMKSNKSKLKS